MVTVASSALNAAALLPRMHADRIQERIHEQDRHRAHLCHMRRMIGMAPSSPSLVRGTAKAPSSARASAISRKDFSGLRARSGPAINSSKRLAITVAGLLVVMLEVGALVHAALIHVAATVLLSAVDHLLARIVVTRKRLVITALLSVQPKLEGRVTVVAATLWTRRTCLTSM